MEELTPDQMRILRERREEWREVDLCTEPADRDRAERAIGKLYRKAGRRTPERFVWCASPVAAMTLEYLLRWSRKVGEGSLGISNEIWEGYRRCPVKPGKALMDPMWKQLRSDLGVSLEQALTSIHARHGVWGEFQATPWAEVAARLEFAIRDSMKEIIPDMTGEQGQWLVARVWGGGIRSELICPNPNFTGFGGQMESNWIAHYRFLEDAARKLPRADSNTLRAHEEVARSCGLWIPYSRICIVSERPAEIHLDDRGSFHREDGPAVRFRDGSGFWILNGILVPEELVTNPDGVTLTSIHEEKNAEIKRLRIERFGWDRYLLETGAKVADMDFDMDGIMRALMRTEECTVLVSACTSTGRTYAMEVDPSVTSCEDASRWLMADKDMRIVAQS